MIRATPAMPALTPIGDNPTLLWGMTNAERLRRLARAEGLPKTVPASGRRFMSISTMSSTRCGCGIS